MDEALIDTDPVIYNEFDIGATEFMKKIQKNNYVRTTRYTILSFIPLTLLENFKRMANIYFLCMAILGFMPWSPLSPVIQFLPLVSVIAVSMLKELIEDLFWDPSGRHCAHEKRRRDTGGCASDCDV